MRKSEIKNSTMDLKKTLLLVSSILLQTLVTLNYEKLLINRVWVDYSINIDKMIRNLRVNRA